MLARLFRTTEAKTQTAPLCSATTKTCAQLPVLIAPPDEWHKPASRITELKRRPKRVQIARLYPQRPSESSRHARALLNFIGEECPDFIGSYIPKTDLERTYRELCAAELWRIRHWTAIARHLGCMTKKCEVKRGGIRFVAYQIPRTQFR